ncbi:hypothetical protein [Alteribacter keqinensis]|uniref:hypothetical protein n=1 Tax=Alteribacter keqinensis TaxID=2483800 RepID=UPI001606AD30|nr:hypothetical protein [Alteribacter keqinensis]
MKPNKRKQKKPSQVTLIFTWAFTALYTISYLNKKDWLPFTAWIRRLYEPLYHYFFGG